LIVARVMVGREEKNVEYSESSEDGEMEMKGMRASTSVLG
jgi:hypothetical protein